MKDYSRKLVLETVVCSTDWFLSSKMFLYILHAINVSLFTLELTIDFTECLTPMTLHESTNGMQRIAVTFIPTDRH